MTILEKRNSPLFQKQYFMEILERLAGDPRALVEMYLNYDCDRTALENIFQKYVKISLFCSLISDHSPVLLSSCHGMQVSQSQSPLSSNNSIRSIMSRFRLSVTTGINGELYRPTLPQLA